MGLMQKACETYEANLSRAGQVFEAGATLCPVGHILQKAQLEILLDEKGKFLGAQAVPKEDSRTVIPATEKSASRSGSQPTAHPFSDQLQYLSGMNGERHERYLKELEKWLAFDPQPDLQAVHRYILGGTILQDLESAGLYGSGKKIQNMDAPQWLVRWVIDGRQAWRNSALIDSFCRYLTSQNQSPQGLCMISGEEGALCFSHDKGIIAACNGAKLISSNDTSNFTYRGRFEDAVQACTISSAASQKAHRALQWVAAAQGETIADRTFVCWNPQGKKVSRPQDPFGKKKENAPVFTVPTDFYQELHTTLAGYRNELPREAGIVTAIFSAATTGRLSLTYYSELSGSDFYDRVEDWYQSCCWFFGKFGIEAPPLRQIAECAFGTERKKYLEAPPKLLGETTQRLLTCMLNRDPIPEDIVKQLFRNASTLQRYSEQSNRIRVLCTACAVIRKYHNDRAQKEEWTMDLDDERRKDDRSYQFGRLLAVMEHVERTTYGPEEDREPNAIRLQSVFNERPLHAAKLIEGQLNPYFARLKPGLRKYYKDLIGQILAMICATPKSEWNRPLKDTYLLGYYLQRSALYTKKNQTPKETEDDEP